MRSIFFALIIAVAIATFVNGGSSGFSEWSYFSSGHAEEPQCQEHAKFNPCGPNLFCYPTCGGPRGPPCREGCSAGCFCDEGFILNVADNKCIDPKDCKA